MSVELIEDNPDFLKVRTKRFALAIIKLCEGLPAGKTSDIIAKQLLRSSCSVGANYRAACRAKSKADFINKLNIVLEEIDESLHWIELLVDLGILSNQKGELAIKEANEILSMVVASIKTSKKNYLNSKF